MYQNSNKDLGLSLFVVQEPEKKEYDDDGNDASRTSVHSVHSHMSVDRESSQRSALSDQFGSLVCRGL